MERSLSALAEQTVSHTTSKASPSLLGFKMDFHLFQFGNYEFFCAYKMISITLKPHPKKRDTFKEVKKKKKTQASLSTLRHNAFQGYLVSVSDVLTSHGLREKQPRC